MAVEFGPGETQLLVTHGSVAPLVVFSPIGSARVCEGSRLWRSAALLDGTVTADPRPWEREIQQRQQFPGGQDLWANRTMYIYLHTSRHRITM